MLYTISDGNSTEAEFTAQRPHMVTNMLSVSHLTVFSHSISVSLSITSQNIVVPHLDAGMMSVN